MLEKTNEALPSITSASRGYSRLYKGTCPKPLLIQQFVHFLYSMDIFLKMCSRIYPLFGFFVNALGTVIFRYTFCNTCYLI